MGAAQRRRTWRGATPLSWGLISISAALAAGTFAFLRIGVLPETLQVVGVGLEVTGLVRAATELEERAARHGGPTLWGASLLRRLRRRPRSTSVDLEVHPAEVIARSGSPAVTIDPPETDDLAVQVRWLLATVQYHGTYLNDVSAAIAKSKNEASDAVREERRDRQAALADVRREIGLTMTEGADRAWVGLLITALGVLLASIGSLFA